MAKQTFNNGELLSSVRSKINSNAVETDVDLSGKASLTSTNTFTANNYFTGAVGIGTTTPGVDFDVVGVIRSSNNIIGLNGVFSQGIASGTTGSSICGFKSQNTSSGAIWNIRVNNNNDLVFEYFNGATWSLVKTLTPAGVFS